MTLVLASWRAVARPPLLVPAAVGTRIAVATVPFLDDGYADRVRVGVAVVLVCAWTASADDPAREVATAAPVPRRVRCSVRLLVGVAVVLPVAILALVLGEARASGTPSAALSLQVLAILVIGPAIGFGLLLLGPAVLAWAWRDPAERR
jgi:hypothetical protein